MLVFCTSGAEGPAAATLTLHQQKREQRKKEREKKRERERERERKRKREKEKERKKERKKEINWLGVGPWAKNTRIGWTLIEYEGNTLSTGRRRGQEARTTFGGGWGTCHGVGTLWWCRDPRLEIARCTEIVFRNEL